MKQPAKAPKPPKPRDAGAGATERTVARTFRAAYFITPPT